MIEETKKSTVQENPVDASSGKPVSKEKSTQGEGQSYISIDDFAKVDLRVAEVLDAQEVAGADKLLQLTLSLGEDGCRNVFAGIKSKYKPADLKGRLVVMVANLQPRKMKFGMSEGMVIAAGSGGQELFILQPDSGAKPGMKIS